MLRNLIPSMIKNFFLPLLLLTIIQLDVCSQEPSSPNSCLIDNIKNLESSKDPKCHATASRLEDFMYGTPMTESARLKKIELQKKLVLYIWNKATEICKDLKKDTIDVEVLKTITNNLTQFGRNNEGQWYIVSSDGIVTIEVNDLRQYSSVAYALRAMLSVEQDFLFNPSWNLMPLDDSSVEGINLFLDIVTLASLKHADGISRKQNIFKISSGVFEESWNTILSLSKEQIFLTAKYPKANIEASSRPTYQTIKSIIQQKLESYKAYNQISLPIFLRNIQVYFARHKWPSKAEKSDALKSYLVESLVLFCKDLLINAQNLAKQEQEGFIRAEHINTLIPLFLPFEANDFEDIIYFPKSPDKVIIESYDLDAFRDSGIHWLILEYALNDLMSTNILEPDPFAAELVVETVAQMALLVLRTTGEVSVENGNHHILIKDMESAFAKIQNSILQYDDYRDNEDTSHSPIQTSNNSEKPKSLVFKDISIKSGIDFTHKSSDWLSRLIRSYLVKKDENLVRMAIPPAFGGSGVAAEDINNDGWHDIILLGGMGIKIYLNNGDKTFEDITEFSGLSLWNEEKNSFSEPRQIIVNDMDNDGWQDIIITLVDDQHKVYKNINGLNFEDKTEYSNLGGKSQVGGPATVFDYDNDGLLDVYIGYFGNYINGQLPTLSRNNQNGSPNKLFKNTGDFKFNEMTHMYEDDIDLGWTQAIGHCDINQDGFQDVIVGNDFGINAYYINQGNGYFKNKSKELQTNKPSYTMNVGSTDLNGDFHPDLYISNIVVMEKDEKYVNPSGETKMNFELQKMENIRTVEANDLFVSVLGEDGSVRYIKSDQMGRGYASTGWSWDADFFDYDNDGDEDLYCLNGMNDFRVYGSENPFYNSPDGKSEDVLYANSNREKNNFFVNDGGILTDESDIIGGNLISNSRSAAYLDFDRDGDLDIIINNYHEKAVLLENTINNENHWLSVRLIGDFNQKINRDGIGSNIIIETASKYKIWREVKSTTGYLSVHPKQQYFGLGTSNKLNITVQWANGTVHNFDNISADQNIVIDYNKGLIIDYGN